MYYHASGIQIFLKKKFFRYFWDRLEKAGHEQWNEFMSCFALGVIKGE